MFTKITDPIVILVQGKDSPRYLNARLTNNIKSLTPFQHCLAATLTPQGKTEGLFTVLKLPATYQFEAKVSDKEYNQTAHNQTEQVLLVSDSANAPEVIAAFKRYIVADRLTVTELSSNYQIIHCYDRSVIESHFSELKQGVFIERSGVLYWLKQRSKYLGLEILAPKDREPELLRELALGQEISSEQRHALRIEAGIASFPEEINSDSLFVEAQLREALAFNRGCYVGQEVIERVDALGKVAKKLVALKCLDLSQQLVRDQQVVTKEGEVVGKLLSIAKGEDALYCFAQLKNRDYVNDRLFAGTAEFKLT